MLSPLVLAYVGDDAGGLDALQLLDERLHRPVHVLATSRERLPALLEDGRIDCVVTGPDLTGPALQRTLFVFPDSGADVPVFDLSGWAVDVPGSVTFHQFDAETAPTNVADALVGIVLDTLLEGGEREDRPEPISRGLGQYLAVDEGWRVTDWDPELASWTGVEPSTIVGRKLWEALPDGVRRDVPGGDGRPGADDDRSVPRAGGVLAGGARAPAAQRRDRVFPP